MTVRGTGAEWEAWTSVPMPETGSYVVPGALVPVEIDGERDEGSYVELNCWVVHRARWRSHAHTTSHGVMVTRPESTNAVATNPADIEDRAGSTWARARPWRRRSARDARSDQLPSRAEDEPARRGGVVIRA